jgi:ribosomal protein L24
MAGKKRAKIKKNDQVAVIAGRDKGRRGRVLEVNPSKGKVRVEGIGMIKRHQKANPQANRGWRHCRQGIVYRHFQRAVDRSAVG